MRDGVFYKASNLDDRIPHADQCLTEDIAKFCSHLAHLYSHLSKPCLDIVLMTSQIVLLARQKTGSSSWVLPSALAAGVILITNKLLAKFAPPFGKMIAEQGKKEGVYRSAHSRLITHGCLFYYQFSHLKRRSCFLRRCCCRALPPLAGLRQPC